MKFYSVPSLALCVAIVGCITMCVAAEQPPSAQQSAGPKSSPLPTTPNPRVQPSRQTPLPVPFVSAKTNMVSSKTVTEPSSLTIGGLTLTQSQSQREVSVTISVNFFAPLPGPYEIQCFFLAKNEVTRARYIFNVVQEESKKPTYEGEIHSGTLLGATRGWIGIPFSLPDSLPGDGGKLVDAASKSVNGDTKNGSRIEGWVLRVVYQGHVLKVDSNLANLAKLANRLPELFDDTANGK